MRGVAVNDQALARHSSLQTTQRYIDVSEYPCRAIGVYKGRKKSVDAEAVRSRMASGVGASQVAKQMGISRASVYRCLPDAAVEATSAA